MTAPDCGCSFPTTPVDDPAGLLEQAADVIRTHGHRRGTLWCGHHWYPGSSVCAIGSLSVALGVHRETHAYQAVRCQPIYDALEDRVDESLASWNDYSRRCGDEVVDLFMGLAKDIRNGEVEL